MQANPSLQMYFHIILRLNFLSAAKAFISKLHLKDPVLLIFLCVQNSTKFFMIKAKTILGFRYYIFTNETVKAGSIKIIMY